MRLPVTEETVGSNPIYRAQTKKEVPNGTSFLIYKLVGFEARSEARVRWGRGERCEGRPGGNLRQ